MSSTKHLGVMTADTFKNRTKATNSVCGFSSRFKSRGSSMEFIDDALATWDRICTRDQSVYSEMERLNSLLRIQYACEIYLAGKSDKTSSLSAHRKGVVAEVHRSAETAVSYVRHRMSTTLKDRRGAAPATTGLQPGYANERAQYEHFGKQQNPYSGSALHSMPNFTGASKGQFIATGASTGAERVEFLNREQRLEHLVVIKDGRLYRQGAIYSCEIRKNGNTFDIWAATYAMDKYGNIFSKPEAAASREGLRFNHSTYCAGKEVICAGTLAVAEGKLLCMTNLSGHYRPNPPALRQALILLGEEGINLDEVAIEGLGNLVAGDGYAKASSLVAHGAPAPADWKYPRPANRGGPAPCCKVDYQGRVCEVVQPG